MNLNQVRRNSAPPFTIDIMLCIHKKYIRNPLKDYGLRTLNNALRRSSYQPIRYLPSWLPVPCNDCALCRLRSTAEVIGMLIAASYEYNWRAHFATLTIAGEDVFDVKYDDVKPITDAIRKSNRENGTNYKFYITAEYGSKTHRPHYHGMFYGFSGRKNLIEFIQKVYSLGNIKVDYCSLARFRYTANAHVNKCSHVPFKRVEEDGEAFMLRCEKPFVTHSNKLGLNYVLLNAQNILRDGYLKLGGICYPVSRVLMDYVYKYQGLDPFTERLRKYTMPSVFDTLEPYRKIARKFNFDDSNANTGLWLFEFNRYLAVAEQMLEREYNSRFVLKNNSNSV